jgi:hypothetical protein
MAGIRWDSAREAVWLPKGRRREVLLTRNRRADRALLYPLLQDLAVKDL